MNAFPWSILIACSLLVPAAVSATPSPGNASEMEESWIVHSWSGSSRADLWPITGPGSHSFEVPTDAVAIFTELRWEGTLGQVDLTVLEPNRCLRGMVFQYVCAGEWLLGTDEDVHRVRGDPVPRTTGALESLVGAEVIVGATCPDAACSWTAVPIPNLAIDIAYEMRITVVHEGELPEGYSAFP